MNDLDDAIDQHFGALQLNDDQVERIMRTTQPTVSRRSRRRFVEWGIAASLLIAVATGVHAFGTIKERTESALREAAMNHTRRLDTEFQAQEIAALDHDMTQLPFNISLPGHLRGRYSVVGARYCSMSGNLAAHVKLIDQQSKQKISLFMTQMVDDLKYIETEREGVNGVDVKLWQEGGLFYALAKASI